jgi:hypothetical protein
LSIRAASDKKPPWSRIVTCEGLKKTRLNAIRGRSPLDVARRSHRLYLLAVAGGADIASQLAPPHRGGAYFAVAGGTATLLSWRLWAWIFKRIGIS